jgi:hypothetical protein
MIAKTFAPFFLFLLPLLSFAQLPAGSIAQYPLNNTANDISGNGYNGTLTATTNATNRFGAGNSATGFTAGTSTGTFPAALVTAMQDDFSIGYWFNTTMTAPSSSQWFGGAALVDAEVCGATSDWGTALINGGAVAFGIGNPDLTITSPLAGYNDGNWHFVTATRAEAAGTITLYIDGTQVATTSGTSTASRTAPPLIGLGRNPCAATGVYTGSLDDMIAYSRTLSATEVSNLYNYYSGIAPPLTWLSFSGRPNEGRVLLQWQVGDVVDNDHFEIDRSTDAVNFSPIGIVPYNADGIANPGIQTFQYTDPNPVKGRNFYRIKQVDADNRFSFSRIIEVDAASIPTGVQLQTNPVRSSVILLDPGQARIGRIQVVDLSGRIIADEAPNSTNASISVNVAQLQPGYYFLRISANQTTTTLPFIKL